MKKGLYIMAAALALAVCLPVQAQQWELVDVTHTVTATVGAPGFTVDGEEIPLPEGIFKKGGYVMLPAEPLLKALDKDAVLYHEKGDVPLRVDLHDTTITFNMDAKIVWVDHKVVPSAGAWVIRENQLYLPLRLWKDIFAAYGYTMDENSVRWDAKTQTAALRFHGQELEIEGNGNDPVPTGNGMEPEYILPPTLEYDLISNLGDGYFFGTSGTVIQEKTDLFDSTGTLLQSYGPGFEADYLGESRFLVSDYNSEDTEESVVDEHGNLVFHLDGCKYVRKFSEGMAAVYIRGEGNGFINTEGEMVIPPGYDHAEPFSEGLALVSMDTNRQGNWYGWRYLDKTGKITIQTDYFHCNPFHEGLAVVRTVNNKWGYIDKTGKAVIPPQFDWAGDFCNGTAFAREGTQPETSKIWLIDKTGKKLKLVMEGKGASHTQKYYFGRQKNLLYMEEVVSYTGGHAHFTTYYDENGEIPYEKSRWFSSYPKNLMPFRDKETGLWGYVDEDFRWIIAPSFREARQFLDDYAVVATEEASAPGRVATAWGVIRKP